MRRPFNLGYTGSSFEPHRNRSGIVGLAQPFFLWDGRRMGDYSDISEEAEKPFPKAELNIYYLVYCSFKIFLINFE